MRRTRIGVTAALVLATMGGALQAGIAQASGRPPGPGAASITIEQPYAPPTTEITVDGIGFGHGEHVAIAFDGNVKGTTKTDVSGSFRADVSVPKSATPGVHDVEATGKRTGRSASTTFLVRTDWALPRFDTASTGFNPYENVLDRTNVSSVTLTRLYGDRIGRVRRSAIVNGIAYLDGERSVAAFDLATHKKLWSGPAGGIGLAVANGVVYDLDTFCNLRAFDAVTGKVLWTVPNDPYRPGGSPPVVADGMVFYETGNDGSLRAVSITKRKELWETALGSDQAYYLPAVGDGMVFAWAYEYGPLRALDELTGTVKWTYACGECGSPTVADGTVFVGDVDGDFTALDATSGNVVWTVHLANNSGAEGVGFANGVVYASIYVVHRPDRLLALDATTGDVLWDTILDFHAPGAPIIADGVVYSYARYRGAVGAFSAKDGTMLLELHVHPSHGVTGVYVADGRLYVTNSGGLSMFEP